MLPLREGFPRQYMREGMEIWLHLVINKGTEELMQWRNKT